jgi:LruC domain-containing protein
MEFVKKTLLTGTIILVALLTACRKDDQSTLENSISANGTLEETEMPPGFNYRMANDIDVQIQLNAPDGNPITGVPVTINMQVADSLVELYTIMTDQTGLAQGLVNVPTYLTELVISPNYIGVPNDIVEPIIGSSVVVSLTGARIANPQLGPTINPDNVAKTNTILKYKYLSSYNNQGVPTVLAPKDIVTSQMLQYVNSSLPESKPVPSFHPSFLQQNLNTDLDISQLSDVWITFVHEGAGYTNSLGFYKYPTNNPPSTAAQIDTVYIVFPNASYYNSGGGLHSGDKVKIGTFPAGTSIGFVCISNGWNGASVGDGYSQLFSDKNLNAIANPNLKQQSVLLYDNVDKCYFIGFEDIKRDNSSCDNDFNDLVFYAQSNPVTAISNLNMPVVDNGQDTDHDGVSDVYDEFPTDPSLAYKNVLPAPGTFGTLSFEDLWPARGDYDFNDLVLSYQFEQWTSASGKIKEMKCKFAINAIGAHYKHAFGFQLNALPSDIQSVTGMKIYDDYLKLSGNNTEASQDKATIFAFDNDFAFMSRATGNTMNTEGGKIYQNPDTISLDILFSTPKTQADLGTAPFNSFIVVDGKRGNEVHLAGFKPTILADKSLFGKLHDNTNPALGNYYKTKNNLPYALNVPEPFDYPIEKSPIDVGYFNFVPWAKSSGSLLNNWYQNVSGYRNIKSIYQH